MERSLRVLIVDDSEEYSIALVREILRCGYEPVFRQIAEPDAIVAALEERAWDVVVADYSMPLFRAARVLALFKERRVLVPVIVVSADLGEDVAVSAMKAGANDYLLKGNLPRVVPTIERTLREAEERKRAQAALRASEAKYESLIANIPDVVWTQDFRGRTTFVSPRVQSVFGFSPEEIYGAGEQFWLRRIHPEDAPWVKDTFDNFIKRTALFFDVEYRIRRKDGAWIWLNDRATATYERDGMGYVDGIFSDVSQRKLLEEQLRQSQKMEAFGQLAGGVAHDFNNLLGVIIGYAEMLLKEPGQASRRGRLEQIQKAAERAVGLTRQLLAFSCKQVLQPTVLDLNAIVSDVDKMLRRLIAEDIELVTVLDPGLGRVRADGGQVEQVIVNLAVNARDAMPEGGKLVIETANTHLDEGHARLHPGVPPGPYALLAVSDTGHGMDGPTLARIFEPFFTTKEPGKGTGLGLATVYGIVQQSGGHIGVYSEPGLGTTFKVYLPLLERSSESRRSETPPSKAIARGSETVLVVEDDGPLRAVVRDTLEANGYTVLESASPGAALAAARSHTGPIQLLLTDLIMPEMSGRELAAAVTALRPQAKVVYMSGYTDEMIGHHGLLERGTHFLQKPFASEKLLLKLREALEAGA